MSDPLPQAMALTAIVITLGVTAFGLALAYRAWQLTGHDDVQDDLEDDLIRRRADLDATSATYEESDETLPDEDGTDARPDEDGTDALPDEDGSDVAGAEPSP